MSGRGTTEHRCEVCGVTVVIAGDPGPEPVRCGEHQRRPYDATIEDQEQP